MDSKTRTQGRSRSARLFAAWAAVACWMLFIFALSSWQDPGIPSKLASPGHAALYFVLGVLLFAAMRQTLEPHVALVFALIVASLYGVSDEVHQAFVPTRVPEAIDWAWDTVGAALGAAVALGVSRVARATRSGASAPRSGTP